MENKKYFFLSGLPRSGNTLLSSILNQNPELKVSANSFLCDHLYQTAMFFHSEKYHNFQDKKSLDNLLKCSFDSYYKDWNAKYIIDRGLWGTPINLHLLQEYLNNEIKIICPVRNIVEIIASFIKVNPQKLRNEFLNEVQSGLRFNGSYKSEIELLCEVVTRPNGQLEQQLFSLNNLLKHENKKYLHIIEYENLISSTEQTIDSIYEFLEIPKFKHNLSYIKQFKIDNIEYDDTIFGGKLHDLKSKIKKPNYKVEDILPEFLIQRYSNMEFWRN
jgi:sulfotransferase